MAERQVIEWDDPIKWSSMGSEIKTIMRDSPHKQVLN